MAIKSGASYGSGHTESFELAITENCQTYHSNEGLTPEVVQVHDEGRFADRIGETVEVELTDGSVILVEIIGGGNSKALHLVGTS